MKTSYWRGHVIYFGKGEWFYSDTQTPTIGEDRPCGFCDRESATQGHDACLGVLPGVDNACCGHGQDDEAYIQFANGDYVQGEKAVRTMRELRANK
jgi:hypothetical protein